MRNKKTSICKFGQFKIYEVEPINKTHNIINNTMYTIIYN